MVAEAKRSHLLHVRHDRGYAHLRVDQFGPADLAAMAIDLTPGETRSGAFGYAVATPEVDAAIGKP